MMMSKRLLSLLGILSTYVLSTNGQSGNANHGTCPSDIHLSIHSNETIYLGVGCDVGLSSHHDDMTIWYQNDMDALAVIVTDEGKVLKLLVDFIDVPRLTNKCNQWYSSWWWSDNNRVKYKCLEDHVNVYNGATLVETLCSNRIRSEKGLTIITGPHMRVEYVTDGETLGLGFHFTIWAEQEPSEEWRKAGYEEKTCSGPNVVNVDGFDTWEDKAYGHKLAPPNWEGHEKYGSMMYCSWLVQSDGFFSVEFEVLDVGVKYVDYWDIWVNTWCAEDSVQFFDGNSTADPRILQVCGNHSTLPGEFSNSAGKNMLITFTTGCSLFRHENKYGRWSLQQDGLYHTDTGFLLELHHQPNEMRATSDACWLGPRKITDPTADVLISSPTLLDGYMSDFEWCQWHIEAPCDYKVKAEITKFDLETMWGRGCFDYLMFCDSHFKATSDGNVRAMRGWDIYYYIRWYNWNPICKYGFYLCGKLEEKEVSKDEYVTVPVTVPDSFQNETPWHGLISSLDGPLSNLSFSPGAMFSEGVLDVERSEPWKWTDEMYIALMTDDYIRTTGFELTFKFERIEEPSEASGESASHAEE